MHTDGVRHSTAVADDPEGTHQEYVGILGLGPVERTVTFDDTATHHHHDGNGEGETGEPTRRSEATVGGGDAE